MKIDYVPLLQVQRELHGISRGMERFRQYLRTIWSPAGSDGELIPLLLMNPFGNVAALLDAFLALGADGVAAGAVADASARLRDVPGDYRVALVVADDLMGGGTNRFDYEFTLRFGPDGSRFRTVPPSRVGLVLPRWTKHLWVIGALWSSEAATERAVREAVLTAAHRVGYGRRHGPARTLRDMLAQEGHVMAIAGCTRPVLDAEDIGYTREVLAPYLGAEGMRTAVECLLGTPPPARWASDRAA